MSPVAIPDLIAGRYRPIRLLGTGGMGAVWCVEDTVNGGLERALKWVDGRRVDGPEGERHSREFSILSRLRHPTILPVGDYGRSIEGSWFTAEVLRGELSRDLGGRLSLEEFGAFLLQLLTSLEFLHRNGWVHGDLKGENLRLRAPLESASPELVLIDFGLAHREGRPPEEKILGTVHTMAPEQFLGGRIDRRGDLYSAGVVAHQWWTGKLPFMGPNRSAIGDAHLHRSPPDPRDLRPGLPGDLANLLAALLEKRPDDRPSSAAEAISSLRSAMPGLPDPERVSTLLAQVRLQDDQEWLPAREKTRATVARWLKNGGGGGSINALTVEAQRPGDLHRFLARLRPDLQTQGLQVIELDLSGPSRLDLKNTLERGGPRPTVVILREGRLGSPGLVELLDASSHGPLLPGAPVFWMLAGCVRPSGFLGEWLARHRDRCQKITLGPLEDHELEGWLRRRLPGLEIPFSLRDTMRRLGSGSPAVWERMLASRVRSGELAHDGDRWVHNPDTDPPENRWFQRCRIEIDLLEEKPRRILEALAVLGGCAGSQALGAVSGVEAVAIPQLLTELEQQRWIVWDAVLGEATFRQRFQGEVLVESLSSDRRLADSRRALAVAGQDPVHRTRLALDAGELLSALKTLQPTLLREDFLLENAGELSPLLEEMSGEEMGFPACDRAALLEARGRVLSILSDDRGALEAWEMARSIDPEATGVRSLRLHQQVAAALRQGGDPRRGAAVLAPALRAISEAKKEVDRDQHWALLQEWDRCSAASAHRDGSPLPIRRGDATQAPADPQLFTDDIVTSLQRALAEGAVLRAGELIEEGLARLATFDVGLRVAAVQAHLLAVRARLGGACERWVAFSRVASTLAQRSCEPEQAARFAVDSIEALVVAGKECQAGDLVQKWLPRIRQRTPILLPDILLLAAGIDFSGGWERDGNRHLQELESRVSPTSWWAWEAQLLRASVEVVTGRDLDAIDRLSGRAHPRGAPHEHLASPWCRHALLISRAHWRLGSPTEALLAIDRGIAAVRERGGFQDQGPLWRERSRRLRLLGQHPEAASIDRDLSSQPQGVLIDPEPREMRRAHEALTSHRVAVRRQDEEGAQHWLDEAIFHALRVRAVPLSSLLALRRTMSPEESERTVRNTWRRIVRSGVSEGRAETLVRWAEIRLKAGDSGSARSLGRAAARELKRWLQRSPSGTDPISLASALGIQPHRLRKLLNPHRAGLANPS